jgi:glyoxylase-like metal-dependent hydrolase (beta-lactamase superfamily II)
VSGRPSPDESLISDESYIETSGAGLTYPWGKTVPGHGELIRIADGIRWARIPMPGSLGHINSWILDDDGGVAPVDTGLMLETCSDAWKALFAGPLDGISLTRIFCTHLHPDHTGLAGWLAKKFDVQLWMTRGEWLTTRLLTSDVRDDVPPEVIAMQRQAGWTDAQIATLAKHGFGRFSKLVFPIPLGYRRMVDGDVIDFGKHQWRVVVGSGHSPEHACLLNDEEGVLISGDQVLPRISSNVSINVSEPDANPLGEWLASIDRLLKLPDDLLVCPAHGEPFRGLHVRLCALRDEHLSRLDGLRNALRQKPLRVVDCFPLLFNREIGDENRPLATGEAHAHLRYLEVAGQAKVSMKDGVRWYSAA